MVGVKSQRNLRRKMGTGSTRQFADGWAAIAPHVKGGKETIISRGHSRRKHAEDVLDKWLQAKKGE